VTEPVATSPFRSPALCGRTLTGFPWAALVFCLACPLNIVAMSGCGSRGRAMGNRPHHAMVLRNREDMKWLYSAPEPSPGRELSTGALGAFRYGDHESRVDYQANERTYVLSFDILLVRPVGADGKRLKEVHCRVIDADGAPLAFHGIAARSWCRATPSHLRSRISPHTMDFIYLSEGRDLEGGRVVITTAEKEWTFPCGQ